MKKKKVLVIESENDLLAFCSMVRITRDAGYEVLGIIVGNKHSPDAGIVCTADQAKIIESVRSFEPDVVLLEHDLGLGPHLTGRYFVRQLGLRPEVLVGTSIYDQGYCGREMHDKNRLERHPLFAEKFLAILADLTAKEKAVEPVY